MVDAGKGLAKSIIAPLTAGAIESVVSNRAEVERYYGIDKFAKVEKKLGWNALARACGPAFVANTSRNFVMSSTTFVLTPTLCLLLLTRTTPPSPNCTFPESSLNCHLLYDHLCNMQRPRL